MKSLQVVSKQESTLGIPPAPIGLSREAKMWWKKLNENYEFDGAGLMLLQQGLEALDELRAAQKIIARDGIVQRDRWGQRRAHPATVVLRDSRSAMLKCFNALHLDVLPIGDIGRPSGD